MRDRRMVGMVMDGGGEGDRTVGGDNPRGGWVKASGGEIGDKGVDEGCGEENPRHGSIFGSNCLHGCNAWGGSNVALRLLAQVGKVRNLRYLLVPTLLFWNRSE